MIVNLTRYPSNASLASYIHTMISMANCATIEGLQPYVDWTSQPAVLYADRKRTENQWEWFLEQPATYTPGSSTWVYEEKNWRPDPSLCGTKVDERWELPWNASTPDAVARLRQIVPRFLRIKEYVKRRGEEMFNRHGLDPANTIAVSFRSTDKGNESWFVAISPIERFYMAIDDRLEANPSLRLWIKAEDEKSAAAFRNRYPGAVVMPEFFTAPDRPVMADAANPAGGYDKGLAAMTMLHMFSRCGVFVKNAGNLGDLAAGLSSGEVVCIT